MKKIVIERENYQLKEYHNEIRTYLKYIINNLQKFDT